MKRKTAECIGICGSIIVTSFWIAVLTPFGRHGFPGDIFVIKGAILLAFVGCAIAAFRGSSWWWIAFAVSLVTVVLVVFIAPV
jgi:hypothetical protein